MNYLGQKDWRKGNKRGGKIFFSQAIFLETKKLV
jgi:hypothetical protein